MERTRETVPSPHGQTTTDTLRQTVGCPRTQDQTSVGGIRQTQTGRPSGSEGGRGYGSPTQIKVRLHRTTD